MYTKGKEGWIKNLDFFLMDLIGIELAFVAAYLIRIGLKMPLNQSIYTQIFVLLVLIHTCVVFFADSYQGIQKRGYFKEFKCVLLHVATVFLLLTGCLFLFQKGAELSRLIYLVTCVLALIFLYTGRIGMKWFLRKYSRKTSSSRILLVITTQKRAYQIYKEYKKSEYREFAIAGFILLSEKSDKKMIGEIPVVANRSTALDYLKLQPFDEVLLDLPSSMEMPEDILKACELMGITVHVKVMPSGLMHDNCVVEELAGSTVVTTSIKIATSRQLFCKRAMDIAAGLAGTILTGILTIFIAPAIYLQSPGPIFFSQTRVGRNGRLFRIYKFRTMYLDAEERKKELLAQNEMQGLMFKIKDDPRIFPFGHFLRNTSLDEFPQFLNVLKGDMSLVGTRPPTVDEYKQYDFHHRKRLAFRPGITGAWQVSGRSDIVDFEEVVQLDTEYIQNWGIGQDLRILFKTVEIVLKRKGAA